MRKYTDVPSVHPYLEYVEKFIADVGTELAEKPASLLRQKRALKAVGTVIRMLSPRMAIKLPCPKAIPAAGFGREAALKTEIKG